MGTRASSLRAGARRTRARTADTAAITFYNRLVGEVPRAFGVAETASPKPGNGGVKLLEAVSNLIGDEGIFPEQGGANGKDEDCRHHGHHVLQPAGG